LLPSGRVITGMKYPYSGDTYSVPLVLTSDVKIPLTAAKGKFPIRLGL